MPSPPRSGESEKSFMARCMKHMHEKESDRPRAQMGAICNSLWKNSQKKAKK